MRSPETRQIDGMGGASALTSEVAVVFRWERLGTHVDYEFIRVSVGYAIVTDFQTDVCLPVSDHFI